MDSTNQSIINNLTEKWRQSTSTINEKSIDVDSLTTAINAYFLSIELNPPEIIICDSPMEVHVIAKILSLNTNLNIDQEINEFLNKNYREFSNNIIEKLRKIFKQDESHMTLLRKFQRNIYPRDVFLISCFFEDMYENTEDPWFRDWEIKQAIDAVILRMKESNNRLLFKLLPDENIQQTFEIDYLLNLKFTEFLAPMSNFCAAYMEYYINKLKDENFTLENHSVNNIELDSLILDVEQFMNLQSQGVYKTIVLQDTNSGLIYCIVSKSPKSISLYINENKSTIHNAKGLAINFVDWGLYIVEGYLFTPSEYASFIEKPLTEDDINRMDYVGTNVPIIDALRKHYGFKRPKRYPFYNWFVPGDEEWPDEDATEEDAKIANERGQREREQRIKSKVQDP